MKRVSILFLALSFAFAGAALAEDKKPATEEKKPEEKGNEAGERMKKCDKDAKDKKLSGKERKDFLAKCLKEAT